jgi:hypothetical protein
MKITLYKERGHQRTFKCITVENLVDMIRKMELAGEVNIFRNRTPAFTPYKINDITPVYFMAEDDLPSVCFSAEMFNQKGTLNPQQIIYYYL